MHKITTKDAIKAYKKHHTLLAAGAALGVSGHAVYKRLCKACFARNPRSSKGALKYPADKATAAKRKGFHGWDEALLELTEKKFSPNAIAEYLGESTGAGIRHRLKYLMERNNDVHY